MRAIVSLLFGGTLHRCPDIKWIFSHGGGALGMVAHRLVGLAKNRPELSARVPNGVMAELAKLYVHVVGVATPGALRAVLDIVPMSHLLFGSDYPFFPPEATIKGLAGLKLSAADLQAIERDNALKLMPGIAAVGLLPAFFLLAECVEQRAALIERIERAGRGGELDHGVQLLPACAGAARGERMLLRGDLVVLDQQHAEQDELRGLHVESLVVERLGAKLLGGAPGTPG